MLGLHILQNPASALHCMVPDKLLCSGTQVQGLLACSCLEAFLIC